MGAQLGTKGSLSEPNFTPLIDIVLVVLIIMMVNVPIQIEEMGVKLPGQTEVHTKKDVPTDQLVIAMYEDDTLALNRRLMTEEVLFYEVTRRLRPLEHKNVFIDAAPPILYGRVVDMMDLAREAGASKVGLARLKPQGPLPPNAVAPGSMPKGVSIGSATTVGPVSEKNADQAIQKFAGNIEQCYFSALSKHPEISGRVMLRVSVAPDGSLMDTKISSSTLEVEDEPMNECLVQIGQRLRFEALGEGKTAVVQYPLLFSPG